MYQKIICDMDNFIVMILLLCTNRVSSEMYQAGSTRSWCHLYSSSNL